MLEDKEAQVETEEVEREESPEATPPGEGANQSGKSSASDEASETEPSIDEASETEPETSLEEEFAKLKVEYEGKYDQMLRTVAEYENAKKRAERSKEEFSKYAIEGVIKDIIPIIDSVERAIESTNESKDFDALSEGVQLIHKQLLDSFQKRSVAPIEAIGETFDPTRHEAILHVESDDVAENAVIEEFQRGYILHDRVIRPSMVSVSKGKSEEEAESAASEEKNDASDGQGAADNG